MRVVTLREGRRGGRRGSERSNSRRPRRRTAFLRRKKVTFVGEELGSWIDGHPFAHQRGTEYRIFRAQSGEILIHRTRWSARTTADDVGKFYVFTDLDSAAEKFGNVLKSAGVVN